MLIKAVVHAHDPEILDIVAFGGFFFYAGDLRIQRIVADRFTEANVQHLFANDTLALTAVNAVLIDIGLFFESIERFAEVVQSGDLLFGKIRACGLIAVLYIVRKLLRFFDTEQIVVELHIALVELAEQAAVEFVKGQHARGGQVKVPLVLGIAVIVAADELLAFIRAENAVRFKDIVALTALDAAADLCAPPFDEVVFRLFDDGLFLANAN